MVVDERGFIDEIPSDLAVLREALFPDAKPGKPSRRIRKRMRLLQNAEEVLKRCLQPGETIRYVAAGAQLVAFEFFTVGWLTQYLNRTTLVLTDQRLVLIHTSTGREPEMYANQVRLDRITDASSGLFGLRISTPEGNLTFSGVSRFDKKHLLTLFATRPSADGGLEHLCPRCFHPHAERPTRCARCGEEGKDAGRAGLLSLIFPGLGDWYLGHRGLATFEIIGALMLWLAITIIAGAGVAAREEMGLITALPFLIVGVMAHVFDALATGHHAGRGFYSMDSELPTGTPFFEGGVPTEVENLDAVLAIGADGAGTVQHNAPKRRKRRSGLRSALVVGVVAVLAFAGWIYLSLHTVTSQPSEQELAYVTVRSDLYDFAPDLELDPSSAVNKKERWLDGTYEISHEYDGEEVYLLSSLTVSRNLSEAMTMMNGLIAGIKLGMALEDGVHFEEVPNFYDWGDDSVFYTIRNDYGTWGNVFVARSGIYVYHVELGGLYFDTEEDFADLVSGPLNKILGNPPPRRARSGS